MRDRICVMLISFLMSNITFAQQVNVQGGFIEDSLEIGQEIHFWMAARYPVDLELIFPDSNYNFKQYEYLSKYFEPTQVDGSTAVDTTVYTLQSFEIDPIQYLLLPAFVLDNRDSMVFSTPLDSIYFRDLVLAANDTTSLKQNVAYLDVYRQFNHPLFLILLGIGFILIIAAYFLFGDRIRRKWRIRKLTKEYGAFAKGITEHIRTLKNQASPTIAEKALGDWKRYFEKLESEPFSKLTTKEILRYGYTRELHDALRSIDRNIYGHLDEQDIYKRFQSIEDFTQHRFSMKIEKLKHGSDGN